MNNIIDTNSKKYLAAIKCLDSIRESDVYSFWFGWDAVYRDVHIPYDRDDFWDKGIKRTKNIFRKNEKYYQLHSFVAMNKDCIVVLFDVEDKHEAENALSIINTPYVLAKRLKMQEMHLDGFLKNIKNANWKSPVYIPYKEIHLREFFYKFDDDLPSWHDDSKPYPRPGYWMAYCIFFEEFDETSR